MQSSRDLAGLCSVLDNEPPIKVLTQILSHAQLLDIVPIYVYEIMESSHHTICGFLLHIYIYYIGLNDYVSARSMWSPFQNW